MTSPASQQRPSRPINKNKFELHRVLKDEDDLWDNFVEDSPQGTLFHLSKYLALAVNHYDRYWIRKGNQIKAGLVLILDKDEQKCVLDDLVIHNGVLFNNDMERKETKKRSERF